MEVYLPWLQGRRVGVVCNQTAVIPRANEHRSSERNAAFGFRDGFEGRHLIDTLLSRGVNVTRIFAPEHGFRGEADAGAAVGSYRDPGTGVEVVSIYGASKKPSAAQMKGLDVVLFDIQDVGVRFFTYLSSLHYVMESCAGNGVELVVLDRPNPNGMYVDGPVLDPKYRSFVGMEPIPVVHGMTLGELARMINGQGWLAGGIECPLRVVECLDYRHGDRYTLPIKPSPNLPTMRAVYLYPSLCLFEATPVSVGRGTEFPFQTFGHPALGSASGPPALGASSAFDSHTPGHSASDSPAPDSQALRGRYTFRFTPRSMPGATDPPLKGRECYGVDLRLTPPDDEVIARGFDLEYIIGAYRAFKALGMGDKFFTPFFEKLAGVDYVRTMIEAGASAAQIRARWQPDVERFRKERKPYLLYEE